MKKHLLLLVLAAAFAATSCSKDDDKNPAPAPVDQNDPANDPAAIQLSSQLLTAHDWQLTMLTQNVPGQAIYNDIYNTSFPACQQDDIYTFAASNNGLNISSGLSSCSASDNGKTGTWSLKNAKTLTINVSALSQAGLTGEFTIFLLDNNKMILKQTLNGSEYIATYEKPVAATNTQLLTRRPWKITAETQVDIYNGTTTTTDTYAQMNACEKDNLLTFKANGSAVNDEGPTKCDPNDPQTSAASWAFTNNETTIVLTVQGVSIPAQVLSLTATTLAIKTSYFYQGASSTTTTTYTAQ